MCFRCSGQEADALYRLLLLSALLVGLSPLSSVPWGRTNKRKNIQSPLLSFLPYFKGEKVVWGRNKRPDEVLFERHGEREGESSAFLNFFIFSEGT